MPKLTILEDIPPTLKEAQKAVGGYIEIVELEDGNQLVVNEEGLLRQLEPNPTASFMAGRLIVGDVLLLIGNARLT